MKTNNQEGQNKASIKVGILGGIGVDASIYFYQEIIKRYREKKTIESNINYPQLIINSIPAPELHLEKDETSSVISFYSKGMRELAKLKPDFIVMVCNTIHLYLKEMGLAANGIPIINLPKLAHREVKKRGHNNICVLGTGLTVTKGLYSRRNSNDILLSTEEYESICESVLDYNNGGNFGEKLAKNHSKISNIIREKEDDGAEVFFLGCTEISEILHNNCNSSYIDTLEILIDSTLDAIEGKLPKEYFYRVLPSQ